jgi:threonine/homoserine/homoserine lactone efflux protein
MAEVVGEVIGFAVGIAVSPIPIAAVILMLFASRARVTGPSFLFGWVIGITLVVTVVVLVPGLGGDTGEPSTTSGVIKGVLGLLLLVVAARQWVSRPGPDDETPMPKWMAGADTVGGGGAFGLALLLTVLNPKNLVLAAAAGAAIGAAELSTGETVLAAGVFVVVASMTIAIPVVGYLIAGDRVRPALDNTKEWMIRNNAAVMSVLLLVFGVILTGDAIGILFG